MRQNISLPIFDCQYTYGTYAKLHQGLDRKENLMCTFIPFHETIHGDSNRLQNV